VLTPLSWCAAIARAVSSAHLTGRTVELRGINLFPVKDGRVAEHWAQLGMLGLLQQIGAMSASPARWSRRAAARPLPSRATLSASERVGIG
jgi:hypothetical protein